MRRIYLRNILLVIIFCLISSFCIAEESDIDKQLSKIYKKAEQAIEEGNMEEADFWLARYMGLTTFNEQTKKNYTDLYPLFQKREDLKPTSFISSEYTDEFLDFFMRGTHGFWGIPEEGVTEEDYEFAIRADSDGKYFVQLVISPFLESWYILKKPNSVAIIPLGSASKPPFIVSGRLENNEPVKHYPFVNLDTQGHFLHYVWPIQFHDLDGDGIPELWIRYNVTWGSGFSQMLDIYTIKNDAELVLLKKFEGQAEGIARRLDDSTVEVGEGFGEGGHMGYDKYRIETWQYQDGEFKKTSENIISHILLSDEWEKYYFDQAASNE